MAYDDSLEIDARVDHSRVPQDMDKVKEEVEKGTEKAAKSAESGMKKFSAIFSAAAVAAGQAIYSIGEKAKDSVISMLSAGDDYNKAMNQLSASTGATGEELESLKDVAKGVFANNYGESYDDVASAVANVKKQLGDLPADQLQTITESAFALSDVFEYDIAESTRAAKAMVDNFGISGEYAMELIATGAQNGLDYSGELIDSINEYSVQFAKVGLDADNMFQIFQNGAENGAWNLDKIGDAVKEFSIRAIDGSTTTAEGFAAIGMNADEMAWKFTQGGDTAKQAFQETVAALTSMEDPIARDAAGVALFGTMWEDLGVDAVASLGNIQDGAYATGDAMNTIKEVKYNDVGSAIEGLKRSVGSFTIDARAAFATGIAGAIGTLVNALNSADGDISVVFDGIVNAAKQAFSAFGGLIGGWAENGKKVVEYLVNGIQENLPEIQEKAGEILKFLINGFLNSRKRMIETALPIIQGLVQGISQALPELLSTGFEILQSIQEGINQTLPELINQGLAILQSLITGIVNSIPQLLPLAVNIITSLISGLTQAIVAVLQFAPTILDTLINGIISVLPNLIDCALQILDALITAIIDNLEPILMACVEILMAIVNGLIGNLDKLIDAAFQIIQFLIDELLKNDNLQKILDAAINVVMAVADGIIDNLDKLIEAAFQIIDKIVSELLQEDNITKLIDTGIDLLVKIITGLCRFAGRIAEFAGKLFKTLGEELAKIDWSELGENVLEGIMSGLLGVEFDTDDYIDNFGEYWVSGFKDMFGINSPSKVMEKEVGQWLLPGISVGVKDTSDETANSINKTLKNISDNIQSPKIEPIEFEENYLSTEISVNPPEITVEDFDVPEFAEPEFSEKILTIDSPEVQINSPKKIELHMPEFETPDNIKVPDFSVEPPEISVEDSEPFEFEMPIIESTEIPELSEIEIESPEIKFSDSEIPDFETTNEVFSQHVEVLREFLPKNDIPELSDERITAEIQSQFDEIMVTLNADNFISRFESILSGMGSVSVPQYSAVYGQVGTVSEKPENQHSEILPNINLNPNFSVIIGNDEIKDFIISSIDEANAISGGVSV